MPDQKIVSSTLANGFQLIVEEMADVQSAAFSLLIPAGSLFEPAGANGTAAALCDLVTRGAGDRDHRDLATRLDYLGVQRHEQVGWNFIALGGALLAEHLPAVLPLYADIVCRPRLPEDEFEAVLSGLSQGLLALEDDPQRKLSTELRRRTYPEPFGRPSDGDLNELARVSMAGVVRLFQAGFRPNGAILGVAGRVDAAALLRQVRDLWDDWEPRAEPSVSAGPRGRDIDHISHTSTQVHMGIATSAPPYGHPDYYAAWAAANILGGGPSGRLFTEVRERRGLCYSVQASLHSLKTDGRTIIYAGTTTERAQETLDVTLSEVDRLGDGIEMEELHRCQARAKSALIMQQESTLARASSIARDWYHLGRVTTLDEVRRAVEDLTVEAVLNAVHRYPPLNPTILTLGPQPLDVPRRDAGRAASQG